MLIFCDSIFDFKWLLHIGIRGTIPVATWRRLPPWQCGTAPFPEKPWGYWGYPLVMMVMSKKKWNMAIEIWHIYIYIYWVSHEQHGGSYHSYAKRLPGGRLFYEKLAEIVWNWTFGWHEWDLTQRFVLRCDSVSWQYTGNFMVISWDMCYLHLCIELYLDMGICLKMGDPPDDSGNQTWLAGEGTTSQ